MDVDVFPLFTRSGYEAVRKRTGVGMVLALAHGYIGRIADALRMSAYDVVWLYREATPFGPPWFESFVRYALRKPIVYDFDDAIWLAERQENALVQAMRCRWKVAKLCGAATVVTVGNDYLKGYAALATDRVTVVPTTVDTCTRYNAVRLHRDTSRVAVGWTGSRSTNEYLRLVAAPLNELRHELDFEVVVISDAPPSLRYDPVKFVPWSAKHEVQQLLQFDIGLMPLDDTPWSRGKCGFKLIQYMALGIPPVASAVGANNDIVRHGVDGFLCATKDEWKAALRTLIMDPQKRQEMGRNARARVEQLYDASRQAEVLAEVFREAVAGQRRKAALARLRAE